MNFSHFFIDRPIFAGVLSIIITLAGAIALTTLPLAQYPEIAPPTISVTATYPGANARVVAETVATPIEQEVNGVEGMLYMSSQSTSDGVMTLTVTFKLGTDLDIAQVLVQNRVAIATPRLPEDVRRTGVIVKKQSPDITMVVHLVSPDGSLDSLYTSNYALLQVRDELARIDGVGDINVFGAREYSMRVWLDPERIAARNLTSSDVVKAIQEQNLQVAAGIIGAPPVPAGAAAFQFTVNTQGRLTDVDEFGDIVVKSGDRGEITRIRDVGRVELAALDYTVNSKLGGKPATALVLFQRPGSNALATSDAVRAKMAELKERFPPGLEYAIVYDPTTSVRESIQEVQKTLFEAIALVVLVVLVFLQTWRATIIPLVAVPVSLIGTFAALAAFGFSLNNLSLFGLVLAIGIVVDDAIVVVENVEHHLEGGEEPRTAARKAMDEVSGPVVAVALVLSAVFIPTAFVSGHHGAVLPAIRPDHRGFDGDLGLQFAHAVTRARRSALAPARRGPRLVPEIARWFAGLVFPAVQSRLYLGQWRLWPWRAPPVPPRVRGAHLLRRAARPHRAGLQGRAGRFHPDRRTKVTSSPSCSCPMPRRSTAPRPCWIAWRRSRGRRRASPTPSSLPASTCSAATRRTPARCSSRSRNMRSGRSPAWTR